MPLANWEIKPFDRLSLNELYDILKLRIDVFVVEQNCVYAELDEKDRHPGTLHMLGKDDPGRLLAYLRILPPGSGFKEPGIGRVVVSGSSRRQGLCRVMVQKAVEEICRVWPGMGIKISAQLYLETFYKSLGFIRTSEPYLEDGISHVEMIKETEI